MDTEVHHTFVGVDFAWGESAGTGVCVVRDGRVVDSARLVGFDDIVDWLSPYTAGACLAAVDAPLIVRNLSGQRRCEWLVSKCFSKYEAGAHSSNRGPKGHFRDGGRAFRLAHRLGLSLEPDLTRPAVAPRSVEVYPHPALVALFDLPGSLKYKAKRRRTVQLRKEEFTRCIALLESLDAATPNLELSSSQKWRELKTELLSAATDSALDHAEDEMDAYICAYTASFYWTHGVSRCRVVTGADGGYIVTPVSATQAECLDRLAEEEPG